MTDGKVRKRAIDAERGAHVDELLDEALQETFPASDPVSIETDLLLIDSITRHRVSSQEAVD
jgi:hypothetical protein